MQRIILSTFILVLLAGCRGGALEVRDPWARPGFAGGTSAVYFTIENPTSQADTLLNASSEVAEAVELHRSMEHQEGTMTMEPQDSVPVPAEGRVEFQPGGLHVMLINLRDDLGPGDSFQVMLTFEQAGEMTIAVEVREP